MARARTPHWKAAQVMRASPPAPSTTSVSDAIRSARWVQIEEIFSLSCKRIVLFTTGAHAQSMEHWQLCVS